MSTLETIAPLIGAWVTFLGGFLLGRSGSYDRGYQAGFYKCFDAWRSNTEEIYSARYRPRLFDQDAPERPPNPSKKTY